MFQRHSYKHISEADLVKHIDPDTVGSLKHDGANFFVKINPDGSSNWISRRESVKGGYPDKTDRLPHLAAIRFPAKYAGHVINVELIHTGNENSDRDSHRTVSGILNSLGPRAAETQRLVGPVRAKMFDVIYPEFKTYGEKLKYLEQLEKDVGQPEILAKIKTYAPHEIDSLLQKTRDEKLEGAMFTSTSKPEVDNPRLKLVHKVMHNLKVSRLLQEVDKDGNLKNSMGAAAVVDATGTEVANVGSGWTKKEREEYWKNPSLILGQLIQVESKDIAANRLRAPVYNGFADGDIDTVVSSPAGLGAFVRTRLYSD